MKLCNSSSAAYLLVCTLCDRAQAAWVALKALTVPATSIPVLWFSCQYLRPPSILLHLFCGAGHEKRRGEQLKWSLACRLYIGSFVFHVHSYQDQFIQPGWAECVSFSLGLHFVCLYCFNLFVCPHPFVFP